MYPENELTRLAAYKAALRRDIALRRTQCANDTIRVLRPLAWADRVVAFCRKRTPLAAAATVSVISLVMRLVFPRQKLLGLLVQWGPLAFGAMNVLRRKRLAA